MESEQTAPRRLGELLVAANIISHAQLETALERQTRTGRKLGVELVALGALTEAQLVQVLSNQLSIPWVSLARVEFSAELLGLIPAAVAAQHAVVPVYIRKVRNDGDTLFVATDDPFSDGMLERIREVTGLPAKAMVTTSTELRQALSALYGVRFSAPPPATSGRPKSSPPEVPPDAVAGKSSGQTASDAKVAAPVSHQPVGQPKQVAATPSSGFLTLTLLDGTKVQVPTGGQRPSEKAEAPQSRGKGSPSSTAEIHLDELIAALAGRAEGADALDSLEHRRWEPFLAVVLRVLVKKGIVSEADFFDEWRRGSGQAGSE